MGAAGIDDLVVNEAVDGVIEVDGVIDRVRDGAVDEPQGRIWMPEERINSGRREFIKAGLSLAALVLASPFSGLAEAASSGKKSPGKGHSTQKTKLKTKSASAARDAGSHYRRLVHGPDIFISPQYEPYVSGEYKRLVERGTLEFLQSTWENRPLDFWKKSLGGIDIEKRVHWIMYWIVEGVKASKNIHPVDTLLVLAQVYAESRFYEFAVSPVCAAGVAQFIPPSAANFGMLCAGDREEHKCRPYKERGYAESYKNYMEAKRKRKRLLKAEDIEDFPEELINTATMSRREKAALKRYTKYLKANVEGLDIFNSGDMGRINAFDQRFGYRHSLPAMVKFLAGNLKESKGYVPVAVGGYNCGMGRPRGRVRDGMYRMQDLPRKTRDYVENIFYYYHGIAEKAFG